MSYFLLIAGVGMVLLGMLGLPFGYTSQMYLGLSVLGGLFCGAGVWRWKKGRQDAGRPAKLSFSSVKDMDEERAKFLQESFQKAVSDYDILSKAAKEIKDREVVRQIEKMQGISSNMLGYLEKNPEKMPAAQKFVDYYQDRAVKLVKEYRDLETTGLSTPQVAEMKERMKETLFSFDEAYEEQFEHILRDRFIDLDAEIKVVQQTMDADGIKPDTDYKKTAAESDLSASGEAASTEHIRVHQPYPPKKRKEVPKKLKNGSVIPEGEWGSVLFTKMVQSFLAIVLGSFGAHKFYQGKTAVGILYAVFFWTAIPGFIGFIEGVRYLSMKMDDFYLKYYKKK